LLNLLNEGLNKLNFDSNVLNIGDYLFGKPKISQLFNTPFFLKEIKKYDVILVWGFEGSFVLSLSKFFITQNVVCRVVGIPYEESILIRSTESKFSLKNYFIQKECFIMQKYGAKTSDYYITCSESLKKYCEDKGICENQLEVITNYVDTELFKPTSCIDCNEKEHFTVTYAGGFQEWQGINNLLKAAYLLNDYDIRFKVIGFSNQKEYKESIKNMLKDKVELLDRMDRNNLIYHINISDICIIPRSSNIVTEVAFPTKFAEYLAMEKPVITTRVGDIPSYIEEYDCGYICEANPSSIADAIIQAKSDYENNILKKKGLNGRKLALKEFDYLEISKKFISYINNI